MATTVRTTAGDSGRPGGDKIIFLDLLVGYHPAMYAGYVYILCHCGNMNFDFQNVRYNIMPVDYIIITNFALASSFTKSDDFDAIIMGLSNPFITSLAIRSNYDIIGHMLL